MKNVIVGLESPWRRLFPLLRQVRAWCWKIYDRIGVRFVISGGAIRFMDATLQFPQGVALTYATPLFWNGPEAYESPTSHVLQILMNRCEVFLDVGSNVGIYAVYAGVKHPRTVVYAFEPVPAIWEKNRSFHRVNGLDDQRVLNQAVGNVVGSQQLILPVYDTGVEEEQTATLQSDSWQSREARVEKIEVACTTLDHFAATNSLPVGFCCVKIDVENHESAVIRGGEAFIAARRPWIVCEVLSGQKVDPVTLLRINDNGEVVRLVLDLGYRIFVLTPDGLFRMGAEDFVPLRTMKDFLFIPKEAVRDEVSYLSLEMLQALVSQR